MSNEKKSIQELMNELTSRLIIPLESNEIICPTCKGLKLLYRQINNESYIEYCGDCHNGKLYVCKHCGKQNKTDYCKCKEAQEERNKEFENKESEKEKDLFKKAKKVKFDDYEGHFIINEEEHIKDADDVYNWLYDMIKYEKLTDEDLPKFLWATVAEPVFTLDLQDIIQNECEDGYDDMTSHLNMNDEDLQNAQNYLDKWYKKQGDSVNIYNENYKIAILLDDLIKKIRGNIKNESEE